MRAGEARLTGIRSGTADESSLSGSHARPRPADRQPDADERTTNQMTVTDDHDNRADPPENPNRTTRNATLVVLGTDLVVFATSSSPALTYVTMGAGLLGLLVHCWTELRKRS